MVNLLPDMDKCFANPDNFDPSNFEEQNFFNKIGFVTFGQGPRNCIGKRYAMISIKIALVSILRKFRLVKTKNTKNKIKQFKFLNGADVPFRAMHLDNYEE